MHLVRWRMFACVCFGQAAYVEPELDERFVDAQSWESLVTTAHRAWKIHSVALNGPPVVVIDRQPGLSD